MQDSLAAESGRLALELHGALSEIDPIRWRAGAADAARSKLAEIEARLAGLAGRRWPEAGARLRARLAEVGGALASGLPEATASGRARWMAFRSGLVPAYESLQATLSEYEIHVPSLRPTNHRRALFHVASGALAITILWVVPEPWWTIAIALPLCLAAWTTELLRHRRPAVNAVVMRLFDPIAHPHEHRRVNSATWYLTALTLLSLTLSPLPCAVGLAALAVGDPVAGLIGRRYGRIRLVHGRSLEGTLAFAVSATLLSVPVALAFAPGLPWGLALVIGGAGALGGALAELLSLRVDDNLSIGLSASLAAGVTAVLLGVPLG